MKNYSMPTRVVMGDNCIVNNADLLKAYGTKAMIVTGRRSAKINGSEAHVIQALESVGMSYCIYDKVMSNPTTECAYEGADFGLNNQVDLIIAIGGGSPIDAAKAMALIIGSDLPRGQLFSKNYTAALPIIAVPTTAGTGSEVTQYTIISDHIAETKVGIASPLLFPKLAFLDYNYMMDLPVTATINTGIDALSHAVEGMLSVKASIISDGLAEKSIQMIMSVVPAMLEAKALGSTQPFTAEIREKLLYASTLAGMVIAQTGTTAVHAMGYSLTYFKNIDHGRANGLLLGEFLRFVQAGKPERVGEILSVMGLPDVDTYIQQMDQLFGEKEIITKEEIAYYSSKAIVTGNINNCMVKPTEADLVDLYQIAMNA